MKHYLELKDKKSSKFWMISLDGDAHTITYGKIGTNGRSNTKHFDSEQDASASARKALASKLKKGYSPAATINLEPTVISNKEAKQRYNKLHGFGSIGNLDYTDVIVAEGDVEIRGHLDGDTIETLFFGGDREPACELIIIDGDLTIHGCLELNDYYPCLLVLGDLRCELLRSIDSTTCVTGDAFISTAYLGHYNDGSIFILGSTHVPYVFNSDHGAEMNVDPKTICFNYYSRDDGCFDYDYEIGELPDVLLEELFDFYDEAVRDDYDFKHWVLVNMFKSGASPFREGKAPAALSTKEIRDRAAR